MGKTAVRLAIKNASAHLVMPSKGAPKQPAYVRGGSTIAQSPHLLSFRSCISAKLSGQKGGGRVAQRNRLANAAKSCSGRGGGG